ncbi:MAG TPA: aminotransferase class V-fold PLP-dependent enzyme [Kofleriaceae bacterium]|nr:aminotransferase class V-fold PLP-dependent enzyme [Kofleriaceae bacterium]
MIPCQRDAFDIPDEVAYFNCAYVAPMLRSVRRAAEAALTHAGQPWRITSDDFFTPPERARQRFAQLIGARPDDVAITPSASFGISTAARNLPLAPGQSIILLEEEFPSNVYAWRALAQRCGGQIVTVRRPPDGDWTSAILEALDPRVAIAALPHCHWADGGLVDLARVSPALQRIGARLVLDVTQSLGVIPLDVTRIAIDYLACAAYKWLLGPYSLGFLYAAPQHHRGEPIDYNWITRADSENFAGLVDYRDAYQPGARRYDMGERASFVLIPMATTALEQLLAWTPAAIHATLSAITDRIAEHAGELGVTIAPRPLRAGHILGLRLPGGIPHGLVEQLRADKIFVSVRGQTVRVAPHLFVNANDVDRLIAALRRSARNEPG